MSKIYKISLVLIILSLIIISYFIVSSSKVDTKSTSSPTAEVRDKELAQKKQLELEKQIELYQKNIEKIEEEYESFISALDDQSKTEQLDSESEFIIFKPEDQAKLEQIKQKLNNTNVPGSFKDFHLLLSRSLLKLSSYVNTANPNDLLAGIELFDKAKEEYEKLNIG